MGMYKFRLDAFEGPLDLLLYLIKKNDVDIYDIPITQITEQYLEYIELMKLIDLEAIGDFLVMAATLIQIKAKMLLPPDPQEQQEEELDPRDELVRRLLEYKQFKEVAENLKEKELHRQDLFSRVVDEALRKELTEDAKEVFFEVSLFDLINAFTQSLRRTPEETIYELTHEEHTVEQKVHGILHLFVNRDQVLLSEIISQAKSKLEIVVTFIAVLELVRLKEIVVRQNNSFEEIEMERNKDNISPVKSPNP